MARRLLDLDDDLLCFDVDLELDRLWERCPRSSSLDEDELDDDEGL